MFTEEIEERKMVRLVSVKHLGGVLNFLDVSSTEAY